MIKRSNAKRAFLLPVPEGAAIDLDSHAIMAGHSINTSRSTSVIDSLAVRHQDTDEFLIEEYDEVTKRVIQNYIDAQPVGQPVKFSKPMLRLMAHAAGEKPLARSTSIAPA